VRKGVSLGPVTETTGGSRSNLGDYGLSANPYPTFSLRNSFASSSEMVAVPIYSAFLYFEPSV